MWYISATTNNGYPYNTDFIGIISDIWTDGKHNYSLWRIDPDGDINDGYPYTYYMQQWLGEGGGGEEGEGDIIDTSGHRRQTRQPTPGTHDTFTSGKHSFDTSISGLSAIVAAGCNVYVMSPATFLQLKTNVADYILGAGSTITDFLANLSGTNIFDGFVMARAYPFNIATLDTIKEMTVFGLKAANGAYFTASETTVQFNFGTITDFGIEEAWQLSQCTFQIYLPFVGMMNFQPYNNDALTLIANVDLLQGAITYILKNADGEMLLIASGNIGINVPINLSQAIQYRNAKGNIIGMIKGAYNAAYQTGQQVQSAVQSAVTGGGAKALGISKEGAAAGRAGGAIGSAGTDALNKAANTALDMITPKQENPAFQVLFSGDDNTIASLDMNPRIIIHKAISYNNANGFPEDIGLNNAKHFENLQGFAAGERIKTINYACTAEIATQEEKHQIENLMNAGVLR